MQLKGVLWLEQLLLCPPPPFTQEQLSGGPEVVLHWLPLRLSEERGMDTQEPEEEERATGGDAGGHAHKHKHTHTLTTEI